MSIAPLTQFYAAYLISNLGNFAARLTMAVMIYALTGSPASLAASFVVTRLPTLLFGNAMAAFVRRMPAKGVMIVTDALALLLFAGLAMTYQRIGATWTVVAFGLGYVLTGLFDAAKAEVLAQLCPEPEQLNRAAATRAELTYVALACGPWVAGWLIEQYDIRAALLFNSATFACSLCLIVPLRVAAAAPQWRQAIRAACHWRGAFGLLENVAMIRQSSQMVRFSCFYLARSITYGLFNALIPVVALHQLSITGEGLGRYFFLSCVGAACGARVYKTWVKLRVPIAGPRQLWYLALTSVVEATALAACLSATRPAQLYLAGFCFSVPMLLVETRIDFLFLHCAPTHAKSAMNACQQFIKSLGFTIGTLLAVAVVVHVSGWVLPLLLIPGILLPLVALVFPGRIARRAPGTHSPPRRQPRQHNRSLRLL